MSIRRNTTNRLRLVRTCYVCGRTFPTTADSPFMRQMYNVDSKKQKTCYFCSESCKNSTYKHRFNGRADIRRQERERAREASRDRSAYNRRYYAEHADAERERAKKAYHAMTQSERDAWNWYRRAKRYTDNGGEIRTARKYELNGTRYTIADLSEMAGINPHTIRKRISRLGWSVEDAVTVRPGCKRHPPDGREKSECSNA